MHAICLYAIIYSDYYSPVATEVAVAAAVEHNKVPATTTMNGGHVEPVVNDVTKVAVVTAASAAAVDNVAIAEIEKKEMQPFDENIFLPVK